MGGRGGGISDNDTKSPWPMTDGAEQPQLKQQQHQEKEQQILEPKEGAVAAAVGADVRWRPGSGAG